MNFSIIIATRDRAHYVERALASLDGQRAAPPFEVIVVDNGSSDGTRAIVERASSTFHMPVTYVWEAQPNRGKARNRGIAVAQGSYVLFCDDDVCLPEGWVAAHAAAHRPGDATVVNGPIVNVDSYATRPRPQLAHYSGAFLCTCNASVERNALLEVGGFDEAFDLYGWEDTELGLRLRERGARRRFAWDAFLWHIKAPAENTLEVEARKAIEKARMAQRFVNKHPSARARLATGTYAFNAFRGRMLPDWLLAAYAGVATDRRVPRALSALARAQFLDAIYTRELARAERDRDGGS